MIDYHTHYHDHGDSGQYELEYLRRYFAIGAERGVAEIGLTEHLFRFRELTDLLGEWWQNEPDPRLRSYCSRYFAEHATQSLDDYFALIESARAEGLPIKASLEVDYYPGKMHVIGEKLAQYPFDYLLGSVHWIGGWGFDDPAVVHVWAERDVPRSWEQYFDALREMAASGVVDVLAHPDLVKKFGHRPEEEPVEEYRKVLTICAEKGIALEVSSAGYRKPVGEAYPSSTFLGLANQAGVAITIASDAHRPEEVGLDFDRLVEHAAAAGYESAVGFEARRPTKVELR